jgi:hypothetical protein
LTGRAPGNTSGTQLSAGARRRPTGRRSQMYIGAGALVVILIIILLIILL